MEYVIRQGRAGDAAAAAAIYEEQLAYERQWGVQTNWVQGVYPTAETAVKASGEGTLYVAESGGSIGGSMILNKIQDPEYEKVRWAYAALPEQVLVIHTLCVAPTAARSGCGRAMVAFAERHAAGSGCAVVRLDTWINNQRARALYTSSGYRLAGTLPAVLSGMIPMELVFFEKKVLCRD